MKQGNGSLNWGWRNYMEDLSFKDPVWRWRVASLILVSSTFVYILVELVIIYGFIYLPHFDNTDFNLADGCIANGRDICSKKITAINHISYDEIIGRNNWDLFGNNRPMRVSVQETGADPVILNVIPTHPKTFENLLSLIPLMTAVLILFAITPKNDDLFLLTLDLCLFAIVLASGTYIAFVKGPVFFPIIYPFAVCLSGALFIISISKLLKPIEAITQNKIIPSAILLSAMGVGGYDFVTGVGIKYVYFLGAVLVGTILLFVGIGRLKTNRRVKIYSMMGFFTLVAPIFIGLVALSLTKTPSVAHRILISIGIILFSLLPPVALFIYARISKDWRFSVERSFVLFSYSFLAIILSVFINYLLIPYFFPDFQYSLLPLLETAIAVIIALIFWEKYVEFAERNLLRLPFPPKQWEENFTQKLVQSQNSQQLEDALRQLIASFRIRSAKIEFAVNHYAPKLLLQQGDIHETAEADGKYYLLKIHPDASAGITAWFGEKESGSYYGHREKQALLTALKQTFVASQLLRQKDEMTALYQRDQERAAQIPLQVADDLHDIVLNKLNEIIVDMHRRNAPELPAVQSVNSDLRLAMAQLRQGNLLEGLHFALGNVVEELNRKYSDAPAIHFNIVKASYRYPEDVERQALFIMRELCINAKKHANASFIELFGELTPHAFTLQLEDDGDGLPKNFMETDRFGLKAVWHRAKQISAQIEYDSESGTCFRLYWEQKGALQHE